MRHAMPDTTHHHRRVPCPRAVREANNCIDRKLRRYSIGGHALTLFHWKTIKSLVDLAALMLVAHALAEGVAPGVAVVAAVLIVSGPEVLEYLAVREDYANDDD